MTKGVGDEVRCVPTVGVDPKVELEEGYEVRPVGEALTLGGADGLPVG